MNPVKDSLHRIIEQVNDEEARQVLEFVERLQKRRGISPTLRRLAEDQSFRMPKAEVSGFGIVHPIEGKGTLASRLLVGDRR